ncbi:MAG: type IV pilin N-terminal domain-containing protein [Halolamina sp.]
MLDGDAASTDGTDRATTSVFATVALVALTVGLAATVALAVPTDATPPEPATASLSLSVVDDEIAVTHQGGQALDVRDLRLAVTVDGDALAHQPPVPFFSATGFAPGPTGPFNSAADPRWTAGEAATVTVAGSNQPTLDPGATVRLRVWSGETLVADSTATVQATENG